MSDSSNTQFRTVMRGYEPAQVDRRLAELTQALAAARQEASAHANRAEQLAAAEAAARRAAAAATAKPAAEPSYADFGERIGKILALADE